jgi:hypothetical protein
MSTTDHHAAPEDRDPIDMAATTLLEVDQRQFYEAFELLVRCHTRDLLSAHPDTRPDHRQGAALHRRGNPSHGTDQGRRRRAAGASLSVPFKMALRAPQKLQEYCPVLALAA